MIVPILIYHCTTPACACDGQKQVSEHCSTKGKPWLTQMTRKAHMLAHRITLDPRLSVRTQTMQNFALSEYERKAWGRGSHRITFSERCQCKHTVSRNLRVSMTGVHIRIYIGKTCSRSISQYLHVVSTLPGEGPYLKVFSKDGGLLLREECLPFRKVHGIRPGSVSII